MRVKRYAIIGLLLFLGTVTSWAITEELETYRGRQPVVVVYSRDTDEPRAFEFNLALSINWDRIERANLAIIDVIPGVYDVDIVARVLEIDEFDFAVLLFNRDGEMVYLSDQADALEDILLLASD